MIKAIEHAMYIAQVSEASVHALYVVDVRAFVMLPDETQSRVIQLLKAEGQDAVETIQRAGERAGVSVEDAVLQGVPHDIILNYVTNYDIDLIVMGTHGRTGEEKRILGSVAEEVVRHAKVPVTTVRMTATELERVDDDTPPEEQIRYIR
ncbi:universal stress protein (plasmid) [Haloferax sp. S1W]|uniref:universal stress protein n=1 Tax=Haloferax sp. S1W TaxID=3377110 RepID=UPI0037C96219